MTVDFPEVKTYGDILISWVHPDHLKTSAHLNTGKNTNKPEETHKKWPVSHSNGVAGTDD